MRIVVNQEAKQELVNIEAQAVLNAAQLHAEAGREHFTHTIHSGINKHDVINRVESMSQMTVRVGAGGSATNSLKFNIETV